MDAKDLREMQEAVAEMAGTGYPRDEDGSRPIGGAFLDQVAEALGAYASLLASVEGAGEEVVESLGFMLAVHQMDPRNRALIESARARIVSDAQEKERLRAENVKALKRGDGLAAQAAYYAQEMDALKAELASVRAERDRLKRVIGPEEAQRLLAKQIVAEERRAAHPKDAQ